MRILYKRYVQLLISFIITKSIFIKLLFHIAFIFGTIVNIVEAQVPCNGSWAIDNTVSQSCISGQLVGALNPATDPPGCPTNPIYTSNQTNTYTFANPVAGFTIDFTGFNSSSSCARIEVKINGVFYPLTNANAAYFSHSTVPPCYSVPFNTLITSDGYLTSSASSGVGTQIKGGIIFRNLNATSVTVSTNDANGTLISDPYNCSSPVQFCSGSWALQRPLTQSCFSGQWVGWQNSGPPSGCPVNPLYPGTETNTFTFTNPVSDFSIDFEGFDGSSECPRIGLKVNGTFFHLTSSNLAALPLPECPSTYIMSVTPDGYLVLNSTTSNGGQGRITINGVNATSVDVSTNDGAGTLFSNPFNCIGVVPLKLESFTGLSKNCNALLNWETGVEQNVREIEIQRSEDAISFIKVGKVDPKGSNSTYSFFCANTTNGYFRLKTIDLDGHYEYSNILSIKSNCSNLVYQVIPNPASKSVEIVGLKNDDKVRVLDILGRKVLTYNSSQNNNIFDIQKFIPGIYILQVINSGMIKSNIKLLKN